MVDQRSNQKRQRNGDDETEQMQRKRKKNDNEAAIATNKEDAEPKSITNICYDCLEYIFDYLDVENLLNLAHTCKRLQIAAAAKFGHDHGKKTIWMDRSPLVHSFEPRIHTYHDSIQVIGLKLCFPFLRCFGSELSNLKVCYEVTKNDHLDRYINQYCADTLTGIAMYGIRPFVIENFPNPFKNVAKILIPELSLGNKLPHLVNLFPNLQHLEMSSAVIDKTAADAVHFPKLEHLSLWIRENTQYDHTNEMAACILHANRQLKSLKIHLCAAMAFDSLLNVISGNLLISKLKLSGNITDVGGVELNRLGSEHSLLEELCLVIDPLKVEDAVMVIRQFGSLKLFEFRVKDQSECDRLLNQSDGNKWKRDIKTAGNGMIIIKLSR